jgi:hypothetical protein
MTSVVQNNIESSNVQITAGQMPRATRQRGKDNGPAVLPHLEHFVLLTRKVQRPSLIRVLLESAHGRPLPAIHAVTNDTEGSLPIPSRNSLFVAVVQLEKETQARIERAAERIALLVDEYGTMAIAELLDTGHPKDAEILTAPTDKFSRALYLYLRQEFPQKDNRENRFDHAEQRQQLMRQFQSEKYSSHYLGPKGVQPELNDATETVLKQRLAELFPQIKAEDILVEQFIHRTTDDPDSPVLLYTLSAMFNGKHVHYPKIINGEATDIDDSAITSVRYSWHCGKGELSVFCDDEGVRPELAKIFRDVVLCGNGDIQSMPMRKFDLMGFGTPAIQFRFKQDRIDGIEAIDIKHLLIANPEVRQITSRNKQGVFKVENQLLIKRDRFEDRSIYDVATQVYKIGDLNNYLIKQTKLTIRIAKTPYRKAHDVSVQITAPNGFNDRKLTKADSELVIAQLMKLDCARQY